MEVRVPPVALEVGNQVTAHLKWPFMPNEITQTGRIQSIQNLGAAVLVKVNDVDFFATGLPDSPGWFTDYDPPALPVLANLRPMPVPARPRAGTPPPRAPDLQADSSPLRRSRSGAGSRKTRRLAKQKRTRRVVRRLIRT